MAVVLAVEEVVFVAEQPVLKAMFLMLSGLVVGRVLLRSRGMPCLDEVVVVTTSRSLASQLALGTGIEVG
jgi:hypothetical protein